MDNELLMKAQFLQNQAQELEQNLEVISREIQELHELDSNLSFLIESKEKSTISTIGKGIHVKTSLADKELFVEVGAGVIVKKTPEEAKKVIQNQMKRLMEAKMHVGGKLDIYKRTIESVMNEIEQKQTRAQGDKHKH